MKNAEGIRIIKEDIRFLESQLASAQAAVEEAQRVVVTLTKRLAERRSSIAPIRLLPTELLSSIFELCALDDWGSAVSIGCVCRHLRNVVLNTPRAWCTIPLPEFTGMTELYLERSRNCKLHMDQPRLSSLPEDVVRRIQCVTLSSFKGSDFTVSFSSLERLSVVHCDRGFDITSITSITFPALRHLDMSRVGTLTGVVPSLLPPLETLGVYAMRNQQTWLAVIRGCSASLKSLCISASTIEPIIVPADIDLPMLHYLRIAPPSSTITELHSSAPRLQVYINPYSNPIYSILAHGWQTITHLRINKQPPLSVMTNIRALQLRLSSHDILELLEELRTSKTVLHHLKSLEFSSYILKDGGTMATQLLINAWESTNYPGLKPLLVGEPWAKEPPWNPFGSVRDLYQVNGSYSQ